MKAAGLVPAAIVALLVLAADQASKAIVRGEIEAGERVELILGVDLVRVGNDGIAFGLLDGASNVVLILAAFAFLVLLGFFLAGAERPALWLPLGLLAGGALGNLVDRVHQGFVTDFIDPPNWPAFNLADAAITVGVVLLVATYLWVGEPERS